MVSNPLATATIDELAADSLECSTISVLALVVFDWLITLSREVALFWTGKARPLSAVLYFTNRYLSVIPCVITAVQMASISDQSCIGTVIAFRVFLYFSLLPPAAFAALRAYALTRCRWLSILVFLLLAAPFVTNMVALTLHRVVGFHSPAWGCIGGPDSDVWSSLLGEKYVFIANRAFAILADTILVIITWKFLPISAVTTDIGPAGGRVAREPRALASIMLYNGMTYFIMLSVLNVLPFILVFGFSSVADGLTILYFTPPLSSVLVSHFLLDLQEAHQRTLVGAAIDGTLDTSRILHSSINFADALGSIGAVVDPAANYIQGEEGKPEDVDNNQFAAAEGGVLPGEGEAIHDP